MIIFRACGGLGNQLFQYAAARRLAIARNTSVAADISWYSRTPRIDTPRQFELFKYQVNLKRLSRLDSFLTNFMRGRAARLPIPRKWTLCRESRHAFDDNLLRQPQNSYLDGYWQSYKYFEEIRALLLNEIQPIAPLSQTTAKVLAQIQILESVAVHVRRGDYVTSKTGSATHGVCGVKYYNKAALELKGRFPKAHFFLFSDDPEWTKQNINLGEATTYVRSCGSDAAIQDLRLMAECRHNIIANSSFSWWGAWLGTHTEKVVYAPLNWFSDERFKNLNLIPPGWNRV